MLFSSAFTLGKVSFISLNKYTTILIGGTSLFLHLSIFSHLTSDNNFASFIFITKLISSSFFFIFNSPSILNRKIYIKGFNKLSSNCLKHILIKGMFKINGVFSFTFFLLIEDAFFNNITELFLKIFIVNSLFNGDEKRFFSV